VKGLERSLGIELFDRNFHRAQLTAKGRELFERAQQLIEFAASLRRTIHDPAAMTGTLRLGVVGVVATTWLPRLIERMRADHPGLNLHLDVGLTGVMLERLRAGHVDLAIVAGEVTDASLRQEVIGHDEFVWMASPALDLPAGPLGPSDLKRWPVLSFTEESHHYPVLKRWFREAGASLGPSVACNNLGVLAACTELGVGVALLPRHCHRAEIAAGRLVVLDTRPAIAPVPFSVVYRTDRVPVIATILVEKARAASQLDEGMLRR
jgi:DNA-binding transcriptional LysR family regulator